MGAADPRVRVSRRERSEDLRLVHFADVRSAPPASAPACAPPAAAKGLRRPPRVTYLDSTLRLDRDDAGCLSVLEVVRDDISHKDLVS